MLGSVEQRPEVLPLRAGYLRLQQDATRPLHLIVSPPHSRGEERQAGTERPDGETLVQQLQVYLPSVLLLPKGVQQGARFIGNRGGVGKALMSLTRVPVRHGVKRKAASARVIAGRIFPPLIQPRPHS